MRDAYVYITLRHSRNDVVDLKDVRNEHRSYINTDNAVHLYEDRICWAIRERKDGSLVNRMAMDIHPHERQNATFFDCGADTKNFIGIVSENATQSYRIFLKRQGKEPYRVLIKVVSADSYQATWEALIDVNNSKSRVRKISKKLSICEYRKRLAEYHEYYNSPD